ncbi:MAG: DMT family transporter [Clostridia bacterium]|nr:DMT family transporter [Clostridia bacterium]
MNKTFIKNSGLALSGGIMIALMVTVNGVLAARLGNWVALVIIHLIGLITAAAVLIFKKSLKDITGGVPVKYMMGGILGVFTILLNNMCVNNIGVSMTLGLALVGQIIASAAAEHLGLLGMVKKKITLRKAPAYLIMTAGAAIMIIWS